MRLSRILFASGVAAVLAAGTFGAPVPAGAQSALEQQVEQRQTQMKRYGSAVRVLTQYVRQNQGSVQEVQAASATIEEVSRNLTQLFPPGSQQGVGNSKAKPEIWQQPAKLEDVVKGMQTASATLSKAAASNDPEQIKAAFGGVGQACGACHEAFRAK
ncbi:MAG TPA: cytochrome c [Azospirillaceae bacterium]|nr:cytochrome c [Azospirillaceae bacterium]